MATVCIPTFPLKYPSPNSNYRVCGSHSHKSLSVNSLLLAQDSIKKKILVNVGEWCVYTGCSAGSQSSQTKINQFLAEILSLVCINFELINK